MKEDQLTALERALLAANAPPAPPAWNADAPTFWDEPRPHLDMTPFRDGPPMVRVDGSISDGEGIERDILGCYADAGRIPDYLSVGGAWWTERRATAVLEFATAWRQHRAATRERAEAYRREREFRWRWFWADEMLRAKESLRAA